MNPEWIVHMGKRILYIDYSACSSVEEGLAVVARAKAIYTSSPTKINVLANCDSKLTTNQEMTKAVNDLGAYSKEIDKVSKKAVIGMDGLKSVFYRAYQLATKDNATMLFKTKEEALDWLAT